MIKIEDFHMGESYVSFIILINGESKFIEIELLEKGHTSMTDINSISDLRDDEWYALDDFMSSIRDMLMCNARREYDGN